MKDRRKTAPSWGIIPRRNNKDKFWRINKNVRNDPLDSLRKKNICPYSKEDVERGTESNHPKHIALDGKCIYCGVLK